VYVEGRFTSRKYNGQDGVERIAYEVILSSLELLSGKKADESTPSGGDEEEYHF